MHYSPALLLIFAGLGLASPSTSPVSLMRKDARTDPSLKLAVRTAHIDLPTFEKRTDGLSERSLEKRRDADICVSTNSGGNLSSCVSDSGALTQVSSGIASLLKSDSNANDCSPHSGSADGVSWKVFAAGRNCDTTAEEKTLRNAFDQYFQEQGSKVCGLHCVKITHGGTYTGFVSIAAPNENLDSFDCNAAVPFGC